MNYKELDDLSQFLLEQINMNKSEWVKYVEYKKYEDTELYYLDINLISFSTGFEYFIFTSIDDELSVFIDFFHTHFSGTTLDMYNEAIQYIEDLLSEKLLIIGNFNNDKWCGSSCIESEYLNDELNEQKAFLSSGDSKIIIRSNNKTYNKEIMGLKSK